MKKIPAYLLMAVMLVGLTACGKNKDGENATSTPVTEANGNENVTPEATPTESPETTPEVTPEVDKEFITVGEKKSTLSFSSESGVYSEEFELTISSATSGVEIYYTTDGSNPIDSETAMLYEGAFVVEDTRGTDTVVSAVDPDLFAGSFNKTNHNRDGFYCEIDAPAAEDVDRCTTIRAVEKYSDGTYSFETSGVYFFGTVR